MTATVNIEAEASVLGTVLVDGTLFNELALKQEHFVDASHRIVFQAMHAIVTKGDFIDIVTVTTALGDTIGQVGGTTYLLAMAESIASTASLKLHERLVFDAYRNRMAKENALTFAANPSDEGLDELIANLQTYREAGMAKQEKTTDDYLLEITAEMCFPSTEQAGFPTSLEDFDDMTGGLQRGELIIVAARPSVGKTAFALNLAMGHAANGGASFIFSLEMGTKQLLQRMISSVGRINSQKWRNMTFSEEDYKQAIQAVGVISDWEMMIYDQLRTVNEIRAAIRKKIRENPDDKQVAIIDYLQLMTPAGKHDRRDLAIGEITRELKLMAVELNIPIVLLSQLSRGVESRQDKRPLMSDLRESGNIEQDADVISFLYREDYYMKDTKQQHRMEIILSKQRNGPTGTVEVAFDKEYGRVVDLGRVPELSYGRHNDRK